jgi:hypothetical protein
LKQFNFDGTSEYSNVIEVNSPVPGEYLLSQNYPNPFNPTTKISFALPVEAKVKVSIYNSLGQKISDLTNQQYSAGRYDLNFNPDNLSSGMYFYVIEAQGNDGSTFATTKKMILLK